MNAPNPWSCQIEMTEGCNRRCSFCGIHSLYREREDEIYKFMTPETSKSLAQSFNSWLKKLRIEFALEGEPLLNRDANKILNNFRIYFPTCHILLTSNCDPLRQGKGFNSEKIFNLFKAGLNVLLCDYYGEKWDMSYTDFFKGIKEASSGIPVFDFYKHNPKVWAYNSPNEMKIVVVDNTIERNLYRTLNNQGGNTVPDIIQIPDKFKDKLFGNLPRKTRCQQPFREMSIKYDGAIELCCMDWTREHVMDKFPEDGSLKQIWNNKHFRLVRNLLFNKRRDLLTPCNRCNYKGYKVGFVQNPTPDGRSDEDIAKEVRQLQNENIPKYGNKKYALKPISYEKYQKLSNDFMNRH